MNWVSHLSNCTSKVKVRS